MTDRSYIPVIVNGVGYGSFEEWCRSIVIMGSSNDRTISRKQLREHGFVFWAGYYVRAA